MIFYCYRFITVLFWPFIYLYILYRKKCGKEDLLRIGERFGKTNWHRPQRGSLIWINAASIGESLSIIPIVNKITKSYPDITILITTTTVTSASILKTKLPISVIHQYMPIDVPFVVKRFLNYWQPNLAIFIESELWPNIITSTAKICPLVLLNARISKRSFKKWLYVRSFVSQLLSQFSLILPQGFVDKERLTKLGATKLAYIGNLKYTSPPLLVDQDLLQELKTTIINRKIIVASSTHKNEEELITLMHLQLRKKFPDLLTIIAPRHTNRSSEIANKLKTLGANYSIRSEHGIISAKTDIYIADTLGELGVFYSLADVVFVGGSLIPQGGHNPIEPAYFDCAILMGPFVFNFNEIIQEFIKNKAIIITKDHQDLLKQVEFLFNNVEKMHEYASAAKKFVSSSHNILDTTVEKCLEFLNK
jgi:3-deoxy-D-manno-octulosonic-acid transferase